MSAPPRYRPVWQTWDIVQTRGASRKPPAGVSDACAPAPVAQQQWRSRMQLARIERCWSIAMLASKVQVDADTLAAYETGDEVIHPDVQRRIAAVLNL